MPGRGRGAASRRLDPRATAQEGVGGRAVADEIAVLVNTFIGRDPNRSVEANWPVLREVWPDVVQHAEAKGVNLAIENCPMLFSLDEWPGGANLAVAPAIWHALFAVWNRNVEGHAAQAVLPYDERLRLLPAYLQQLVMESLGKRVDHAGEAIEHDTVPVLWEIGRAHV